VLGDGQQLTEAFLHQVDVLSVVSDTRGNNEALLGRDVVHDELLEDAGIQVVDVAVQAQARHAERLDTVSRLKQVLLIVSEWVVLAEVLVKVVGLVVLVASDVGGKNGAGLESNVDHHLEHIDRVVLDAVATEVSTLLVVVHLHSTTGHLDHAVVDSLIGVLEGLEVRVLQSQQRTRSFVAFITGANIDQETY